MAARTFENFDLDIAQAGDHYRATVTRAPVRRVPPSQEIKAPFSDAELRQVLATHACGRNVGLAIDDATARLWTRKEVGQRLYERVFQGDVGSCLDRSLEKVVEPEGNADVGLRIRVSLVNAPMLAAIPWEDLCGRDPYRHFALCDRTAMVRLSNRRSDDLQVTPPLRLLVMIANPGKRLDVAREWESLQRELAPLSQRGLVSVDPILPPDQLKQLQERAQTGSYHIFHFIGHGESDTLALEGAQGEPIPVSTDVLSDKLYSNPNWKLIFLNACNTARQESDAPLVTLAQELADRVAPTVVAMRSAISDRAAIALATAFYHLIAQGFPVETALSSARLALRGTSEDDEWSTAVLFSGCDDNRLLVVRPLPAEATVKTPATVAIPAGPFQFGSPPDDQGRGEWPVCTVDLPRPYAIGKYPVTNEEYAEFVKEHRDREPQVVRKDAREEWRDGNPPRQKLRHPVTGIRWQDACQYCHWLSQKTGRTYRLPTEAEWEKAARGDQDARRYPWNGNLTADFCGFAEQEAHEVGKYRQGASPYGCFDMIGNVLEWTCTLWGDPRSAYTSDCVVTCDPTRVLADPSALRACRGGIPLDSQGRLGCAARVCLPGNTRLVRLGFRVLLEIP